MREPGQEFAHPIPMSSPKFPTRKISETILDFAQPMLVLMDSTTPQDTIRQGFGIALTIWNGFVLDRVNGNSDLQNLMRKQLGAHWEANPVIKALVERRMKYFADDLRLVAEHRVSFVNNGYSLWAAASDPHAGKQR